MTLLILNVPVDSISQIIKINNININIESKKYKMTLIQSIM